MKSDMALGALEVMPPKFGGKLEPVQHRCWEFPQVSVPALFTCPISLELMNDPVTLSTGITYDRVSIEKWLGDGHSTCPATNQVLVTQDLIPNHTLRRLIQDWCIANSAAAGVERISVPRQAIELLQHVRRLLKRIGHGYLMQDSLKKLRILAEGDENGRMCIAKAGSVPILAGALGEHGLDITNHSRNRGSVEACEDSVATIALLPLTESDKKAIADAKPMAALCWILSLGSTDGKINAAEVLQRIDGDVDNNLKAAVCSAPGAIQGLVCLLKEKLYPRAVVASLKCLLSLCTPKKNRLAVIEVDGVGALIELLNVTERGNIEHAFALLEVLASCAEGREAISNHAQLVIPIIVKSMVGISKLATEHAVGVLWAVISFSSGNRRVLHTALQAEGAFTKLLMLLPSECSLRSKLRAREILNLLNPEDFSRSYGNPATLCRPTHRSHHKTSHTTVAAVTGMV